jgi:hypothetical protein
MTSPYNPISTFHPTIDVVNDGDSVNSANTILAPKQVADNALFVKNAVTALTTTVTANTTAITDLNLGRVGVFAVHFMADTLNGSWTRPYSVFGGTLTGPGVATAQACPLDLSSHNGRTLSGCSVSMRAAPGHAGFPAVPPKFNLYNLPIAAGQTLNARNSLYSGGNQALPLLTLAAYLNGGNYISWASAPDQNNNIDTAQFLYAIELVDEGGVNSLVGNLFMGASLTFS